MRIFTISLLILILSTCLLAQIPTDSLVAYYPFNGNPYDESGNGYNGVVNGALLTADRFEKPNSAYQFESTNTIDMGDILSSVFVSNIYSMSVWYKCTGQDGALISKWFSGCENTGNAFYMTPGAYCTNRGSNSSCDPYRCTNISVNGEQGRWIHQVVVVDGDVLRVYKDGGLTTIDSSHYSQASTMDLIVGYSQPNASFIGSIDDIRIYKRALSEAEVLALYHEGDTIQVSLSEMVAHQGDTVLLPVNVQFPTSMTYSSAELNFGGYQHNGLDFLGIDTTSCLLNNKGWQIQINNTDTLLITASAGAQDISGSGTLLNLQFVVTGSPCTFVPITITKAVFNTGTDPVTTTNGGVNIKAIPVYGDVNIDGQVQAYDASVVLKYLVGSVTLDCQQMANANVTTDTTVSALDATGILKYVVHLITSFPYTEQPAIANVSLSGHYNNGFIEIPINLSQASNVLSLEARVHFDSTLLSFDDSIWPASFTRDLRVEGSTVHIAAARSEVGNPEEQVVMLKFKTRQSFDQTVVSLLEMRLNENAIQQNVAQVTVTPTGVGYSDNNIPKEFVLSQNYPNPFNPTTTVSYAIPGRSQVKLEIFNTLGQIVSTLVNAQQEAGYYDFPWQANTSSGMYFYRIQAVDVSHPAKSFVQVRKMVLMK